MRKSISARKSSYLGLGALFVTFAAVGFAVAPSATGPLHGPGVVESPAIWNSSAETIREQAMEADTIVRVQIIENLEPHTVSAVAPGAEGLESLAATVTRRGLEEPLIPFTSTVVEVLEVYNGKLQAGDRISLLQTGADLNGQVWQLIDDPLYQAGTEHVLFLADISSDPVHAKGGEPLFRTLNPASRYQVHGTQLETLVGTSRFEPPADLGNLEAQIGEALSDIRGETSLEGISG